MTSESHETREAQALREVGSTSVSPAVARGLVGGFLAFVLAVPLAEALRPGGETRTGVLGELATLLPDAESVRSLDSPRSWLEALPPPALIQAVETAIEDQSLLQRLVLPPAQYLLTRFLRVGNEQVLIGEQRWLFYRPSVEHLTGPGFLRPDVLAARRREGSEWQAPPEPDPVLAITDFQRQLKARGIELLVVPVPVKASLLPDRLRRSARSEAPLRNASMSELLARMQAEGVRVLDLAPVLMEYQIQSQQPAYLRTDTHWSPAAMQAAAVAIARELQELGWIALGDTPYRVSRRSVEHRGDLAAMLKLDAYPTAVEPEAIALQQVSGSDDRAWSAEGEAPVLLLGDSYANIFSLEALGWGTSAGLAEHLSLALGQPIDAIRRNDAGAHATRQQLAQELRAGRDRLAGKRVVVWEFTERELSWGDWKQLDLHVGPGTPPKADARALRVSIEADIVATTPLPPAGSVPYADALVSLHLENVRSVEPSELPGELLVYTYGLRDHERQPAARLRPGQRFAGPVVPWQQVEARLGALNRLELRGEEALTLPAFYAPTEADELPPAATEVPEREPVVPSPAPASGPTDSPGLPGSYPARWADQVRRLEAEDKVVLRGREGWLFFRPELRYLSVGPFSGAHAASVSRSPDPDSSDPREAIVDFAAQLRTAGIRLVVAPVPAKAAIYPEATRDASAAALPAEAAATCAAEHDAFLAELRQSGVEVVDLGAAFREHRGDAPLYCRQDTHWSPAGIALAASVLADRIRSEDWYAGAPRRELVREQTRVSLVGDLAAQLDGPRPAAEELPGVLVLDAATRRPLNPDRDSPVLLLGDSHTLVFHAGGDMHAAGAGLPDLLAAELLFAVDVVGVRGAGSTAARINLLRRRDNLAGKRVVLWVFAAREFTESTGGWRKVPIIR